MSAANKERLRKNGIHIRLSATELALVNEVARHDRRSCASLVGLVVSDWIERTFGEAAPTYPNEAIQRLFERWRRSHGLIGRDAPPNVPET